MTSFSDSGAAATRTHSRMALELQATAIASSTVSIAAPVPHRTGCFDSKAAIEVRCVLS
jgi:hypothetical protein